MEVVGSECSVGGWGVGFILESSGVSECIFREGVVEVVVVVVLRNATMGGGERSGTFFKSRSVIGVNI